MCLPINRLDDCICVVFFLCFNVLLVGVCASTLMLMKERKIRVFDLVLFAMFWETHFVDLHTRCSLWWREFVCVSARIDITLTLFWLLFMALASFCGMRNTQAQRYSNQNILHYFFMHIYSHMIGTARAFITMSFIIFLFHPCTLFFVLIISYIYAHGSV